MNYSDREIEALARWAMSPDPVNWELFNSQPLEERLRAFDWWWDRWWYSSEFEHEASDAGYEEDIQLAWIQSKYFFLDVRILLYFGIATHFSVEVETIDSIIYDSIQERDHNSTDDYPLDQIKNDIYNVIKSYITQ